MEFILALKGSQFIVGVINCVHSMLVFGLIVTVRGSADAEYYKALRYAKQYECVALSIKALPNH